MKDEFKIGINQDILRRLDHILDVAKFDDREDIDQCNSLQEFFSRNLEEED